MVAADFFNQADEYVGTVSTHLKRDCLKKNVSNRMQLFSSKCPDHTRDLTPQEVHTKKVL